MINLKVEEVTQELLEEVAVLAEDHYNEVMLPMTNVPFQFPYEVYKDLYSKSSFDLMTARDDEGKLLGYLAVTYQPDIRTETGEFVAEEGFYVIPEARGLGVGKKLIEFMEQEVTAYGMDYILMAFPEQSPLIVKLGYGLNEYVYIKRLK